MSRLIIDNHIIKQDIKSILSDLKSILLNGKLKDIRYRSDNVRVTCPVHKDGYENKPSCDIYVGDSPDVIWGTTHCFTCGFKGQLFDFIAEASDKSVDWAKKWLKDNFTEQIITSEILAIDEPIILGNKKTVRKYIAEKELDNYQSWHPYMQKRHLSRDICKEYDVKYDPKSDCIIFPVRDLSGKIKFITKRSVSSKKFIIDKDIEKEVYLLYNIINKGIKEVYVCESQINALTLLSWGYPAIALLGTGSDYQYSLLKKSGILKYDLCFDGDEAGKKGITRFIKNMDNVFISIVDIPNKKDVNDLTKEEFDNLKRLQYN